MSGICNVFAAHLSAKTYLVLVIVSPSYLGLPEGAVPRDQSEHHLTGQFMLRGLYCKTGSLPCTLD